MNRWINGYTDRHIRWMNRQMDRQIDRLIDGLSDRSRDTDMVGRIDVYKDRQMD
jgi:hypothetical protein